jgi:hypothetical protein
MNKKANGPERRHRCRPWARRQCRCRRRRRRRRRSCSSSGRPEVKLINFNFVRKVFGQIFIPEIRTIVG